MYRLEKKEDGSIDFYYQGKDGETKCLNCGLVLFGTGRKPIVHDMGLEVTLACVPFALAGCPMDDLLHLSHTVNDFLGSLHKACIYVFVRACVCMCV